MLAILFAILAGLCISLQNAFNTNVQNYLGKWETTSIVHIVGLVFSLLMVLLFGTRDYSGIAQMEGYNKLYLLAGIFGVFIVYTTVSSISMIGTALTISILVISQLIFAALIDHFGLFGLQQITMTPGKVIGLLIMIVGVIIFKYK